MNLLKIKELADQQIKRDGYFKVDLSALTLDEIYLLKNDFTLNHIGENLFKLTAK